MSWWKDISIGGPGASIDFDDVDHDQAEADAKFIAASRQDVPDLLGEIDRLSGLLGECEKALQAAHGAVSNGHSEYSGACGVCVVLTRLRSEVSGEGKA
jgi:hypothetical protein